MDEKYLINKSTLTETANVIREKTGITNLINPLDFGKVIELVDLSTLEYMQIMDLIDSKELTYSQKEIDKTDAYIEYYRKDVRLDGQTL